MMLMLAWNTDAINASDALFRASIEGAVLLLLFDMSIYDKIILQYADLINL